MWTRRTRRRGCVDRCRCATTQLTADLLTLFQLLEIVLIAFTTAEEEVLALAKFSVVVEAKFVLVAWTTLFGLKTRL